MVELTQEQISKYMIQAMIEIAKRNYGSFTFKKSDLEANTGNFTLMLSDNDEVTFIWKPFGQRMQ
jgi:hypothetical protein